MLHPESAPRPAAAHAAPAAVAAVSVKLPEFWMDDPEMWFAQAEAHFRRAGITVSATKFDYVLMQLPAKARTSVREIVRIADTLPDPYEVMKTKLTASYTKSRWRLVFELFEHPDLGDRRPSEMMDALLSLLPPGEPPGDLFMGQFLKRLPASMRSQLALEEFKNPAQLAASADSLWDARGSPQSSVSAVGRSVSPGRRDSASPSRQRVRQRSPDRPRDRRRPTPGPGSRVEQDSGLCYYHDRWGRRAHKCEAGCSWTGNGTAAGGGN
jgi:hypothetical protein